MDKIKIGIPRGLFYYYEGYFLNTFFKKLGFEVVVSPPTNRVILDKGMKYSNDEMCLSLKVFLGHVEYLIDKCDYLLIMRIDNYGRFNQTCTNFLGVYDLVFNMFEKPILDLNINHVNHETMYNGLKKIARKFDISNHDFKMAYEYSKIKTNKHKKNISLINRNKLYKPGMKILLVGHSYNLSDKYIGTPIIKYLEDNNINVVLSDSFNDNIYNKKVELCPNLYWYYNKENISALEKVYNLVDGIIFLSSFPCGPDSLVNELVIRKINKPCLNLIIDDLNSLTGIETRLESFLDILEQKI